MASSLTFPHSQGLLTVPWMTSAGISFRGSWVGGNCLSPTLIVLPPLTGFSTNLLPGFSGPALSLCDFILVKIGGVECLLSHQLGGL